MQTKIMYSLIALFITITVVAQQPLYTATINDNRMPEKETSFSLSIVPDKVATAFGVFVQNPGKKKIQVQITHLAYGVLVDTSFTTDQFNCRYNFDQVEDGHYQVSLISGKEKVIKDIEINTITKRNLSIR
jgi:hypothetical protein